MGPTESVARLFRAGNEHSQMMEKLRTATDQLAAFLGKHLPVAQDGIELPGDVYFNHWPSGEYVLRKRVPGVWAFVLTHNQKSREHLLNFSRVVAEGWLDEMSIWLERQSSVLKKGAEVVERFLENRSPV